MELRISSSSNPLLKQLRSLKQTKVRRETGLFVVEGIHPVGEAVQAGWQFEKVVFAPDLLTSDFAQSLIKKLSRAGVSCIPLENRLFSTISEKENPQGILAIVKQKKMSLDQYSKTSFSLATALVSPQDPGNIGTILRTMDATGAAPLFLLDGGADPYHPTAVRASMGSLFWIPIISTTFVPFIHWVKSHGYFLLGTSAHAKSDYKEVEYPSTSSVILLGSEQKGLSESQMTSCDMVISIPMNGRSTSLNLAVAAGILLYSFKRK